VQEEPPPYRPSRQVVIAGSDLLQPLGHSGLDQFILEMGVEGLSAGREIGGLQGRATALADFAVKNPDALTREGEPIGLAVVRRAAEVDIDNPHQIQRNIRPDSRARFWRGLERDGFRYDGGAFSPIVAADQPAAPVPDRSTPAQAGADDMSGIKRIDHRLGRPAYVEDDPAPTVVAPKGKPKVFIVHGRDDNSKETVARFIEKIGLEAVILHERPNSGRTLITKFQEESSDAAFALILMTPDDFGGLAGQEPQRRARQNVVFELGFFIGKLDAKRVCALVESPLERPSDFDGVAYIEYGPTTNWRMGVARELQAAGVAFDHSKVIQS